jgi:AcrR family transcriptional regulator
MEARARTRLSRQDWVNAALEAIAEGGLAAVAVVPLAERLGATKGSFYWHFPSREALIEAALAAWEQTTTSAVVAEIEAASQDPRQQLRLLFKRVTELAERDRIELALLATADHPTVLPALDRVTRRRIAFAAELFQRLGFPRADANRRRPGFVPRRVDDRAARIGFQMKMLFQVVLGSALVIAPLTAIPPRLPPAVRPDRPRDAWPRTRARGPPRQCERLPALSCARAASIRAR